MPTLLKRCGLATVSQPPPECIGTRSVAECFGDGRGFPQAVRTRPQSSGTACPRSFFHSCESLPRRHSGGWGVVLVLPGWLRGGASVRMPNYVSLWPRRIQAPGLFHRSARILMLRQMHTQRSDCIEAGTPHSLLGFAHTPLSPVTSGARIMKPRSPSIAGALLVGIWREARPSLVT